MYIVSHLYPAHCIPSSLSPSNLIIALASIWLYWNLVEIIAIIFINQENLVPVSNLLRVSYTNPDRLVCWQDPMFVVDQALKIFNLEETDVPKMNDFWYIIMILIEMIVHVHHLII